MLEILILELSLNGNNLTKWQHYLVNRPSKRMDQSEDGAPKPKVDQKIKRKIWIWVELEID